MPTINKYLPVGLNKAAFFAEKGGFFYADDQKRQRFYLDKVKYQILIMFMKMHFHTALLINVIQMSHILNTVN